MIQNGNKIKKLLPILIAIMITISARAQDKPAVVPDVDLKRYAGTWYEIARLPNSFERNLKCITATYTLRDDGKITVLNKGRKIKDPLKTSSAKGVAWLPDKNIPGKLKVQFFWPFSGDYWILYLDKEYRYVLVGDPSYKYLWVLSRQKKMDEQTYYMLLEKATDQGYEVKPLIRVDQDCD
jgi:apolipoprotein D and lipocalin family protein